MAGNSYASQSDLSDLQGWFVYVAYEFEGLYSKIGTASTVKYRISGLQGGNPRKLVLHKSWHLSSRTEALKVEKAALSLADVKRVPGRDWVLLSHTAASSLVLAAARHLEIPLKEVVRP